MFGTYQQDTESSGSGIIIGENDTELLIVTNYHVVSGSNELSVVFSYDEDSDNPSLVSAKLKGYDSDKDLAVISVALSDITDEMKSQIKVATIGDSSSLQLGQEASPLQQVSSVPSTERSVLPTMMVRPLRTN